MSGDFYGNGAASTAAAAAAAAAAATSSRWLTEEVFKLIDMVQRDEAIYNPRHKYYFCRPYVENFWREVDLKLEKNPGASLAKWTNLRISFRREYTNYLEEKVPPCWSYFDRMFFLHPYLRKKHQQPKSLDSQVQDALAQINSLSSRLQRERVVAAANAAASMAVNCARGAHVPNTHTPSALDTYLEYFDEAEQNNSELDEIIEDEHQSRFQHMEAHSLHNDIKSECDDQVDDYEADVARHDEDEHSVAVLEADGEPEQDDDTEMRNYMLDSQATSTANEKRFNYQQSTHQLSQHQQQQQQLQRIQQLQRMHVRSCHEDFRAKRPRSHESISSTQQASSSSINIQSRSAVSFVRPTFTKPVDLVSTTTSSNLQLATSNNNNNNSSSNSSNNNSGSNNNSANEDEDGNAVSVAATTSGSNLSSAALLHHHHHSTHQHQHATSLQRHLSSHHHHHRLEIAAVSSGNANTAAGNALGSSTALTGPASAAAAAAVVAPAHVELCDCKTDPDAMFLMSLLPDIQKLNGRDRGKIKIAFQNILQDYLYPD